MISLLRAVLLFVALAICAVLGVVAASSKQVEMFFGNVVPRLVVLIRDSVSADERVAFLVGATGLALLVLAFRNMLRKRPDAESGHTKDYSHRWTPPDRQASSPSLRASSSEELGAAKPSPVADQTACVPAPSLSPREEQPLATGNGGLAPHVLLGWTSVVAFAFGLGALLWGLQCGSKIGVIAGAVGVGICVLMGVCSGVISEKFCRFCQNYGGRQVSRVLLSSERVLESDTTTDYHYGEDGTRVGSTSREIVRPTLLERYRVSYSCSVCGKEWSRVDEESRYT